MLLTSLPAVSDTGHPAAAAVAWVPSLGLRRRRGGSAATDNREVQGRGAGRSARVLGSVRSARGTTRPTCPNPLLPLPHRAGRQQPGSLTDPESPNSVIPRHLQDSPRLLRDCGEAGDKWRGEPWFISVSLLLWPFYTGTLPAVVYFLFLIFSLVSSFPTFLLFF